MPHLDLRFRPAPGMSVAPLAAPPTPPEAPAEPTKAKVHAVDQWFSEETLERVTPMPRLRVLKEESSPVVAQAAPRPGPPGQTPKKAPAKNPFVSRVSISKWGVSPYRVMRDMGIK